MQDNNLFDNAADLSAIDFDGIETVTFLPKGGDVSAAAPAVDDLEDYDPFADSEFFEAPATKPVPVAKPVAKPVAEPVAAPAAGRSVVRLGADGLYYVQGAGLPMSLESALRLCAGTRITLGTIAKSDRPAVYAAISALRAEGVEVGFVDIRCR